MQTITTASEAAKDFGVTTQTIRTWIAEDKLNGSKIGEIYFINIDEKYKEFKRERGK